MDEVNQMPTVEVKGNAPRPNPLAAYYRQPKIYITLPSKGKYYPEGTLDTSEDGKYAVYSMTAKDELMFKTPDALLSGKSTVEVIQSCIPSIKDAWHVPSIDLDAILVAIRIATYGESMDIDTVCPKCREDQRYDFNLPDYLNQLSAFNYIPQFSIGELVFHIRPYTYKEVSNRQITNIEQERIYNIVNDDKMSDEEKVERFGASFVKLTELTIEAVSNVVHRIDTPNGSEDDSARIRDFILNAPKEIFNELTQKLSFMKEQLDLKVKNAKCTSCENVFDIAVTMDQANFFGVRS